MWSVGVWPAYNILVTAMAVTEPYIQFDRMDKSQTTLENSPKTDETSENNNQTDDKGKGKVLENGDATVMTLFLPFF